MLKKLKRYLPLTCIIFFFIFINLLFIKPIDSGDLWFHLRIGQDIFETRQIPTADHHSFTADGSKYINQNWLSQLILFLIYQSSGFFGLQLIHSLLILGTFLLLFFCFKSTQKHLFLLTLSLIVPFAIVHNEIRPYFFTWFFSALLVFLISKRKFHFIPFVFLFWVNMHAGFILAIGALFFYLLIEFKNTKKIYPLFIFLLSFLATFINPSGFNIYFYPFSIESSNRLAQITEWSPFGLNTPYFWLYLIFVISLIALILKTKAYQKNIIELIFVVFFSIFGFISMRYPINVCILLFPIFVKHLCDYFKSKHQTLIFAFCCFCLILFFFLFNTGYKLQSGIGINHNVIPVYGLDFITKNQISGKILNDYFFGGYMIWKQPETKVFIDSRMEVYHGNPLKEYLTATMGLKDWQQIIDKYNIDCIFLQPSRLLSMNLLKDKSWDLVYFDNASIIFIKKESYPHIRRLENITPYGYRYLEKVDTSINESQYLLDQNPKYFGAHKSLASLYFQKRDFTASKDHLNQYFSLYPEGRNDNDLLTIKNYFKIR